MTFGRCIKAINSEWDFGVANDTMDMKGNKYKTFYIINNGDIVPDYATCLAIAEYSGMRYHKGYFYKKY